MDLRDRADALYRKWIERPRSEAIPEGVGLLDEEFDLLEERLRTLRGLVHSDDTSFDAQLRQLLEGEGLS